MRFIGDKLTHLREVLKLTQKDVEKLTGVKAGHISGIETGARNPRPETVKRIAEGLSVDEHYFYLQESRLPADVLPEMPPELERFIADGSNVPWLALTEKAQREGISYEALQHLIDIALEIKRT